MVLGVPSELRTESLTVRYRQALALDAASIVVPSGSITGLVGPNGAGKSSLILALYGSVPSAGSISFGGEEISRMSASARVRLGLAVVPQGRQLFPHLSVKENLRVMAELLRVRTSAIDEALDRFPILRTRMRSPAGVMSGGEQQMLVVARALMGSPKILLLDEMATGLAPVIVQGLLDTIRELAAEGVAILYAAPEIGAVSEAITRGYVLIRGRITECTEPGGGALDRLYRSTMGVELGARASL